MLVGAVVDEQVGNDQTGRSGARGGRQTFRGEGEEAFLTAEEELAAIMERSIGRETQIAEPVLGSVAGDYGRAAVVERQAYERLVGGEPEAAQRVFLYRIDAAAFDMVEVVDRLEAVGDGIVAEPAAAG